MWLLRTSSSSPLEGSHHMCTFCRRECHHRSWDSRSTIDFKRNYRIGSIFYHLSLRTLVIAWISSSVNNCTLIISLTFCRYMQNSHAELIITLLDLTRGFCFRPARGKIRSSALHLGQRSPACATSCKNPLPAEHDRASMAVSSVASGGTLVPEIT